MHTTRGLCRVTINNKGIEYQCTFFEVSGNGPALLGMINCKRLKLLILNCQTTNDKQKVIQINEQTTQVQNKQQL